MHVFVGILICGMYGMGKTTLAKKMCKAALKKMELRYVDLRCAFSNLYKIYNYHCKAPALTLQRIVFLLNKMRSNYSLVDHKLLDKQIHTNHLCINNR